MTTFLVLAVPLERRYGPLRIAAVFIAAGAFACVLGACAFLLVCCVHARAHAARAASAAARTTKQKQTQQRWAAAC